MGTLQKFPPKCLFPPPFLINSIPSHSTPKTLFFPTNFRPFCTSSVDLGSAHLAFHGRSCKKNSGVRASVGVRVSGSQLKENWLDSLSCPLMEKGSHLGFDGDEADSAAASECVIGIDPDISGALAVLKGDGVGFSAQVFDTPHLQVLVGKRVRKRLDARSIVQLLRSFAVPEGTIAYIEQSRPFPKDGKQGWWSGGFSYGLWIGILVASGFSVVPVSSLLWKNQFELCGSSSNKDDSRRAASALFPSLSSLLKRKKDHGRAEALLIAAYGKGFNRPSESCVECDAKEEMRSALLVKGVMNEVAETDQPIWNLDTTRCIWMPPPNLNFILGGFVGEATGGTPFGMLRKMKTSSLHLLDSWNPCFPTFWFHL